MFYVIPAIDLLGGKCVRLFQGDYNKETVYSDNPVDVAAAWADAGAKIIHVVDLDGAKQGKLVNIDIVSKIASTVDAKIEFGGGIRTISDVKKLKNAGISYSILGTSAIEDKKLLSEAKKILGDGLVIGIDARNGKVSVKGWLEDTNITALDFAKQMEELGINRIIYTDISKDGASVGPNLQYTKEILKNTKNISVTVSGGVSGYHDIENSKNCYGERVFGVIVGKALYEKKIDLAEAVSKFQR